MAEIDILAKDFWRVVAGARCLAGLLIKGGLLGAGGILQYLLQLFRLVRAWVWLCSRVDSLGGAFGDDGSVGGVQPHRVSSVKSDITLLGL